jgi:predicted DCC family thiol-disulfide oxidoreductase YuxK
MTKPKVYFDGKCIICSTEIAFYQKKKGSEELEWVDISTDDFNAQAEGLDPEKVQKVFHVRDENGQLFLGVDGFIEIWKRIPTLKLWVQLSHLPGARIVMNLGYTLFTQIRPYLPRRKTSCTNDHCKR